VPGFTASTIDGDPLVLRSGDGRLTLDVPAGARGVRFVYHEPTLLAALRNVAVLVALPLVIGLVRRSRRR
jgi:hypothetical protein